jgi:hypothetical protein
MKHRKTASFFMILLSASLAYTGWHLAWAAEAPSCPGFEADIAVRDLRDMRQSALTRLREDSAMGRELAKYMGVRGMPQVTEPEANLYVIRLEGQLAYLADLRRPAPMTWALDNYAGDADLAFRAIRETRDVRREQIKEISRLALQIRLANERIILLEQLELRRSFELCGRALKSAQPETYRLLSRLPASYETLIHWSAFASERNRDEARMARAALNERASRTVYDWTPLEESLRGAGGRPIVAPAR